MARGRNNALRWSSQAWVPQFSHVGMETLHGAECWWPAWGQYDSSPGRVLVHSYDQGAEEGGRGSKGDCKGSQETAKFPEKSQRRIGHQGGEGQNRKENKDASLQDHHVWLPRLCTV